MLATILVCLWFVASSAGEDPKSNIILFLTDDQDYVLNGMTPMSNVKRFISNNGLTFTNSYTTSPICCPSRSSILTGLYVHNHKTTNNSLEGGCYGDRWRSLEQLTFANILAETGYKTFYAGKYLNMYGKEATGGPEMVPPGWSNWHGLVGNSVYYNYTLSNNGVPTYSSDLYLTDVIRDLAINFISEVKENEPFLMVIAPPAPHDPFTPAPRHEGLYRNVSAPRTKNFNVPTDDKHWLMRLPPVPLPSTVLHNLDKVYRGRWQTLAAVDELVGDVVSTLHERDLLGDTYLIYTSDNGFHVGQFSQPYDKRQPYETDIKVPLVISGPGIPHGTTDTPVLNIDLAPTILHLAGLEPPGIMDGQVIDLYGEKPKERYMLIEYYGEGNINTVERTCPWRQDGNNVAFCSEISACKCQDARNNTYACIRHFDTTINFKYCLFQQDETFEEIYDLNTDPYELVNITPRTLPAVRRWYQMIAAKMKSCKGVAECDNALRSFVL